MVEHVYIHIPFCLRKCRYCSFVSGLDIKNKDIYIDALLKEISGKYRNERLKTIYIGGGTPSLLEAKDLKKIIECFNFNDNTEITIETNPETVILEKMKNLKSMGINRVSLGIQTFNDNILTLIGRNHNKNKSIKAVEIINKAGFNNINIDLIYGLPSQTIDIFKDDLKQAKNLDINHISAYGLKIEESSYFYKNRPQDIPNDEIQVIMYNFLCDYLDEYEHYEISNFAKNGFKSEHNYAYWLNKEYYGFGLNSSGYENNIRYKNTSKFSEYVINPLKKEEEIKITEQISMENEIILGLRLCNGIDIKKINQKYKIDFIKKFEKIINKYLDIELIKYEKDTIRLTRKGILLSNEIMSEFIEV